MWFTVGSFAPGNDGFESASSAFKPKKNGNPLFLCWGYTMVGLSLSVSCELPDREGGGRYAGQTLDIGLHGEGSWRFLSWRPFRDQSTVQETGVRRQETGRGGNGRKDTRRAIRPPLEMNGGSRSLKKGQIGFGHLPP